VNGRVGRALVAIRDQPIAAAAMGIDIAHFKTITFGVSAMFTGIAGALSALLVQFVAPDSFAPFLSISFLIGIVVGGLASPWGAVFGAMFIHFVPNIADSLSKAAPWAVFGAMLIVCVSVMPHGVAGVMRRWMPQVGAKVANALPPAKFFVPATVLLMLAVAVGAFVSGGNRKRYDPGASDSEIKIGNMMPYSGPASAWGVVGKTEAAYFRMINDRGGINGRKITFISLDHAYSPPKAVEGARRLVEQEQVLLLFSVNGTSTSLAIRDYLENRKVPNLFVASGASQLNDPVHAPWTIQAVPRYRFEGHAYARHILQHFPAARIGILYQNDDFGRDYLDGVRAGLGAKTGMIVAEAAYELNAPSVDSQVVELRASGADVFLIFAANKSAAQAIRKAYDIGWRPTRYVTQTASSTAAVLEPVGFEKAKGILSLHWLKDTSGPRLGDDPAIKRWLDFLNAYYPEADLRDRNVTAGYCYAEAMVHVLQEAGDHLTRENIMRIATHLNDFHPSLAWPGITLETSETNHAPVKTLQMVKFDGAQWVMTGELFRDEEK
jgi:ABC-type branched-subunit amino acid transport system substrate-binding protein